MQQQFWDFPSFRRLWQGDMFFTTGSSVAFSVLIFFPPLPSFFLWEENLLEVKQIIIKKTSPSPESLMVSQEGPDDPVFPTNVVVTSNLSPPNVPTAMTSVLQWKGLSS